MLATALFLFQLHFWHKNFTYALRKLHFRASENHNFTYALRKLHFRGSEATSTSRVEMPSFTAIAAAAPAASPMERQTGIILRLD